MKNSNGNFLRIRGERFSIFCTLLFLFFIFSASFTVIAQGDSATLNNGPSFENIKKTSSAISEKIRKDARRKEILGYVYMILGFTLVIAVAWFSTVKARKYRETQDEKKRKYLEAKIAAQGGKTVHRSSLRKGHRK